MVVGADKRGRASVVGTIGRIGGLWPRPAEGRGVAREGAVRLAGS